MALHEVTPPADEPSQYDDSDHTPSALRGGLSLLSWSLFRGASLATFLRSMDPNLHVSLAIWRVSSTDSEPDPRYPALRRARWRLLFVLPFFFLLLCYAALWLLPVTFDWNRSWLFARYAFATAFICDLLRRVAPRSGERWIDRLISWVTFSAFGIPLMLTFFPAFTLLKPLRLDQLLARWVAGERLVAIVLAMVFGAIMTTAGLAGSLFVVISAIAIGLIGQNAFDSQLALWSGLAAGLTLGLVIAPLVDMLLGALIVIGFFQAIGSLFGWAVVRAGGTFDGSEFAIVASLAFLVTHLRIIRYMLLQLPRALYLQFQISRRSMFDPALWTNHPLRTDETVRFPLPGLVLLLRSAFQQDKVDNRGIVLHLLANIGSISGQRIVLPRIIRDLVQRAMVQAADIFQIIRFRETVAWLPTARCPRQEQKLLAELYGIGEQLAEAVSAAPHERRQTFEVVVDRIEQLRRSIPAFTLPHLHGEPSVRRRWRQVQNGSRQRSDSAMSRRKSELFLSAPFIRITPPLPCSGYDKALVHWSSLIRESLDRPVISTSSVSTLDDDGTIIRPIPAGSALFRGYTALFRTIEHAVMDETQPRTLLLLGQPLIGKTTILNQLTVQLSPHIIPVICDLSLDPQALEEELVMVISLAEGIRWAAQQSHYGISIRPFHYELCAGAPNPYDLFLAWVEDAVVPMLGDRQRLLLVFNHYEALHEPHADAAFFASLSRLIEIAPVTLGLCGNLPPERCDQRWTTTLVGVTQYQRITLPFMHPDDADATLRYLVAAQTGFRLTDAAVRRITEQCGGHPYLLHLVALTVTKLLHERLDRLALDGAIRDDELVHDAITIVRDGLDPFVEHYSQWLERLTDTPEVVIDVFLSVAANRPINQTTHPNLQAAALQLLRLWQVVEERNGTIRLTLPLIESWARQLFAQ